MYQSPGTMEYLANSRQEQLLREARDARLARAASRGADHHSPAQHRLVAVAVGVLLIVAFFALV